MAKQPTPFLQTNVEIIECRGGLNLTAPAYEMRPGQAMLAVNYEIDARGNYRRMEGWERFDGHPAPSDAPLPEGEMAFQDFLDALQTAQEARRAAIAAVPGIGPVRGVAQYNGAVYAFRDFDDGSAVTCRMYRSTPTGWQQVTTPTLQPGGRYQFVRANFVAAASGVKLYGVDGANKPFMFDGTTFTQLSTPASPQQPTTIAEYQDHLFLGFAAGSVLHSKIGSPNVWDGASGAGEIGFGDTVTGLVTTLGALVVLCSGSLHIITGRTIDSFEKQTVSNTSGAFRFTGAEISDVVFQNNVGIGSLQRTQNFGGFNAGTISAEVEPLLTYYRSRINAAVPVRRKNQIRFFCDDGNGITLTLKQNVREGESAYGYTTFKHPFVVVCADSGGASDGRDILYAGADNGFVYRLDAGRNADGAELEAAVRLVFHGGGPRQRRRYLRANVHVVSEERSTLTIKRDFDFASPSQIAQSPSVQLYQVGGDFFGAASARFGRTVWGGKTTSDKMIPIAGVGYTVSLLFHTKHDFELPHSVQAVMLDEVARKRDVVADFEQVPPAEDEGSVVLGGAAATAPAVALLPEVEDFMNRWTTQRTGSLLRHGDHVIADNVAAPCLYLFEPNPRDGDTIRIRQSEVSFSVNRCDVNPNGKSIRYIDELISLDVDDEGYEFVWREAANTWMVYKVGEAAD